MRILITGASEPLGAGLACDLLDRGQLVRVQRPPRRDPGRPGRARRRLSPGLARPARASGGAVRRHRCHRPLYRCGRRAERGRSRPRPGADRAALQQQVAQFVYVSSARVYERGGEALKEDQVPAKPASREAQRRLQLERLALAAGEFGPQVTVLRPAQVLGLADRDWARWLLERAKARQLGRSGNGLNRWDFTSAGNLRKALVTLLLRQPAATQARSSTSAMASRWCAGMRSTSCCGASSCRRWSSARPSIPGVSMPACVPRSRVALARPARQPLHPGHPRRPGGLRLPARGQLWNALEEYRPRAPQARSGPV